MNRSTNIVGISTLITYSEMKRDGIFPSIEVQKHYRLNEFSSSWNEFIYHESSRAAEQLGYSRMPLAFFNDILYAI